MGIVDAAATRADVRKWAADTFGADFRFREHQEDSIVDIITSWMGGKDNIVVNAPTGSGKSVIAMCAAGVMNSFHGKTGYILVSDLSLLQQYADDVETYLPDWGVIRGQDTYTCMVNGYPFPSGECKLMGCTSYSEICAKYPECAPFCEYVCARDKAASAGVVLCTYQFWLTQQNFVCRLNEDGKQVGTFVGRDFVICDEAHKLMGLVQDKFSPKISKSDEFHLKAIYCAPLNGKSLEDAVPGIENRVAELREALIRTSSAEAAKDLLIEYQGVMETLRDRANAIKSEIDLGKGRRLTKEEKSLLRSCKFFTTAAEEFSSYNRIVAKIGTEAIILNDDRAAGSIQFNCIDESYLMNSRFHRFCPKKLYLSATIGDPDIYVRGISARNAGYLSIPETFDYAKSPIYYVDECRMSYREKDGNFDKMADMVRDVLKLFEGMRGIIQTGSYAFSKELLSRIGGPDAERLLVYGDTKEKRDVLEAYRFSKDKVLVGPSLVEGLSLDDDLCRFLIVMKVPYPSLADKLVRRKMEILPGWYANEAAISLLQGVGRGVRSKDDWCCTFILDGCFTGVFYEARGMFGESFVRRLVHISSAQLKRR